MVHTGSDFFLPLLSSLLTVCCGTVTWTYLIFCPYHHPSIHPHHSNPISPWIFHTHTLDVPLSHPVLCCPQMSSMWTTDALGTQQRPEKARGLASDLSYLSCSLEERVYSPSSTMLNSLHTNTHHTISIDPINRPLKHSSLQIAVRLSLCVAEKITLCHFFLKKCGLATWTIWGGIYQCWNLNMMLL